LRKIKKIFIGTLIAILLLFSSLYAQNIPDEVKTKLENYEQSIKKYQLENNKQLELDYLNKAAFLCWNSQLHQKSLEYFSQILEINKSKKNQKGILLSTNYIGMIYEELQDYTSAVKYFNQALDICRKINNKEDIASSLVNVSQTYQLLEDYEKSNSSALEGINVAKEINNLKFQRSFYGILANNYQSVGDSENSIKYFDLFASIDKFLKKQEIKTIKTESETKVNQAQKEKNKTQIELNKQTDKLKITEDSLAQVEELSREQKMQLQLKESRIRAQDAQLKFERLLRSILIVGFIAVLIFFIILFRFYKKIKTQKLQIELQRDILDLQNKKINASIQYAQNIQRAILPVKHNISESFENFIIYKPKDVVSGDFYWYAKLGDIAFIASVDCTGHGVPGAFMSMIGNSLLNEIVLEKQVKEPAKILSLLNEKVIEALRQEETENSDGMDVCFIAINLKDYELTYSGAKRPLILFNQNKKELEEIKGDRISIGGKNNKNKKFTNHIVKINSGDILYLSSDGLTDQNNSERKRFGTSKLQEIIKNNISASLKEQQEIIEKELQDFQEEEEQRDDISLIGLKIK
jgi:serine phosphatase RsbU (regulator of sigma subunit)